MVILTKWWALCKEKMHYRILIVGTPNIINQAQDKLNGETAMRYIQDTNPIVIIDEPQSVDNTDKAKEAITSLNPLFILKYSATHRETKNLVYKLTPVDAYQMGLVKQICVSSNVASNGFNRPYVKLVSVSNDTASNNVFIAKPPLALILYKGGSQKSNVRFLIFQKIFK